MCREASSRELIEPSPTTSCLRQYRHVRTSKEAERESHVRVLVAIEEGARDAVDAPRPGRVRRVAWGLQQSLSWDTRGRLAQWVADGTPHLVRR